MTYQTFLTYQIKHLYVVWINVWTLIPNKDYETVTGEYVTDLSAVWMFVYALLGRGGNI